ncbi:SET DOMAIN GROUP 41 protein [Spatholobus suberectus]|nr:SET DOMAIN GROUP 41 protein [Spatholobus suberectus]
MNENVGELGYGPRLVLRTIKKIKKGGEVTIAYTDLLQSKFSNLIFNYHLMASDE